jgi:FtsH-binding integral membrane protein
MPYDRLGRYVAGQDPHHPLGATMPYELEYGPAAVAEPSERAAFIRRTYSHLAGAILAFIALEVGLFFVIEYTIGRAAILEEIGEALDTWWPFVLLPVVLLAFVGAWWLAQYWARSQTSVALRYVGLGLYVVATAVIYLPLLIIAGYCSPNVIPTAGILGLATFGGLTITAFVTRKEDFSFLAPILSVGSMIALGLIVVAIYVGFDGGVLFAAAMVALISGYILYYTSNVKHHNRTDQHVAALLLDPGVPPIPTMHHYRTDQHVAAALALFAAGATLIWIMIGLIFVIVVIAVRIHQVMGMIRR